MKCDATPGKPLNKYPDEEVETVCKSCPLFGSKPENTPEDLQPYIAAAFELAELRSCGARFTYPDGLQSWEWMALEALGQGRSRADAAQRKRDEKKVRRPGG